MPAPSALPRRQLLVAAAAALGAAPDVTRAADAAAPSDSALAALRSEVPLTLPRTELVYEALFDLAPTLQLGRSPFGERRIVPITGGRFEGPGLRGKVMPGGADRQLSTPSSGSATGPAPYGSGNPVTGASAATARSASTRSTSSRPTTASSSRCATGC